MTGSPRIQGVAETLSLKPQLSETFPCLGTAGKPSAGFATRGLNSGGQRCTRKRRRFLWRAAGLRQPRSIRMHDLFFPQRGQGLPQNLRGSGMRRHCNPVVHPLPFAPRRHEARTAQIGKVARDLWLWRTQYLHEVAHTNLLLAHQVQQTEPRFVAQSLEETFEIEARFYRHDHIFALTDVIVNYIVALANMFCGGTMHNGLLDSIKAKYGTVAASELTGEHAGVQAVAQAFGYTAQELKSIPAAANMGLSCGNPTALAHVRPGEVVVDLGSGGGLDVFLAAQAVGPHGRAIGIDMTPEMISRARANAQAAGYANVEFQQAVIDRLPLPSASVDCVISNCVLNLAPDKPAVFREIYRILKPGGRLAMSDIALKTDLPVEIASSLPAWIGCIAGAIRIDDYHAELLAAGFEQVVIVDSGADLNVYAKVENQSGCCSLAMSQAQDQPSQFPMTQSSCCSPAPQDVHGELRVLLSRFNVNAIAASVKIYAIKQAGPPIEQTAASAATRRYEDAQQ